MKWRCALLGLGSNLGTPSRQIHEATKALACHPAIRMEKSSPIYVSAPMGSPNQDDYCNAALRIKTTLSALLLLDLLQWVERQRQRQFTWHWGPRTLDADLLFYEDLRLSFGRLCLPHPHALERDFVVQPLIDILGKHHVLQGRPLKHWLRICPFQRITGVLDEGNQGI